jgi:hypothetical protein
MEVQIVQHFQMSEIAMKDRALFTAKFQIGKYHFRLALVHAELERLHTGALFCFMPNMGGTLALAWKWKDHAKFTRVQWIV